MALGMDPRFDLTRAYWLVAGITGVNSLKASIGSAASGEWVVDADLAYEIVVLDAVDQPLPACNGAGHDGSFEKTWAQC